MRIVSAWYATSWRGSLRLCALAAIAVLLFWNPSPHGNASATPANNTAAKATCATCHEGIAATYSHAAMQHALLSPGKNPVLEEHPNLSVQIGKYSYSVLTRNGQSTYKVTDGTTSLTLPIRWIFGVHSQTWVLEKDGSFYESQVSFFRMEQGLAITPGHAELVPHNITEAMGRKTSYAELMKCFNCHSTGAIEGTKLTLDKLRPGLSCERCHQDADRHMAEAIHDNYTTLPKSLKAMNAEDAANFCGQCHRTWDMAIRNHWHGPADVRFQPYRLVNSKCFLGSDARISCMACHDPHKPVDTKSEDYDATCLACHGASKHPDPANNSHPATVAKICTVAKSNCASCHMPKIDLPEGHAAFTDHEIRIVRPNDPYPN
jgi:Cytochrome c554 and c-prime